jgi:hypothetical protein
MIAQLLAQKFRHRAAVEATLDAGGLPSWSYPVDVAMFAWNAAVPDAIRERKLDALIQPVIRSDPAFGIELEKHLRTIWQHGGGWLVSVW